MSESTQAQNTAPIEFFAGTTVAWDFSPTHKPGDGFTCTLRLAGPADYLEIEATELDDDTVTFRIAPEDTEEFPTGVYQYQITATDNTDTYMEAVAELRINTLIGEAGDNRSVAEKIVDAIDALILGRADTDQMSYQIGNRALSRIPLPDLRIIRRDYANIVAAQRRKQRKAAGLSVNPAIKFRFS